MYYTEEEIYLGDVPRGQPNCGIVAIKVLTGVSYHEAYQYAKSINKQKRWKGSMLNCDIVKAVEVMGKKVQRVAWGTSEVRKRYGNAAMHNVVSKLPRTMKFMLFTKNHVVSIVGGKIIDQSGVKSVTQSWTKSKYVTDIYLVS